MKGVEATAHNMKGMLANVSFALAAVSAACLERMGQQHVTQGLPEELAGFEQEASLALAELEAFCTKMITDVLPTGWARLWEIATPHSRVLAYS
jgi:HPt (histidine-containing phosphotransfer) domain-containing protein